MNTAATENRLIDRGNADLRNLQGDFGRIGVRGIGAKMATSGAHGHTDSSMYRDLMALRNALAHGNQRQLDQLRNRGIADTVTWTRSRLPGLNRIARAVDQAVWDHLTSTFETEPW